MSRQAVTAAPLHPLLAERWSPRSFDPEHRLTQAQETALLEAARWAPSARNVQPWRFLVGHRGDATFKGLFEALMTANQEWAGDASALIGAVVEERLEDGRANPSAAYDLGQAVAHLSAQAHAEGLHVHQMGGFHPERVRAAFGVPEGFLPLTVVAVGRLAPADRLPPELHARETAARARRPLKETVYHGGWGEH
ncbi:nitroreductase family protein [Streptacidiphilus monticola]|uniref:Nitroreductase family protein n=1 Tax=Streptacidiphilus monticola TaxID=2161674 RepID=A0ABW1G8Y5_9ACTN